MITFTFHMAEICGEETSHGHFIINYLPSTVFYQVHLILEISVTSQFFTKSPSLGIGEMQNHKVLRTLG